MKKKLNNVRIGLDVDGVLSCFSSGVIKRAKELGLEHYFPTKAEDVACWDMCDKFSEVMREAWTEDEFWLNLPSLVKDIPFKPYVYITSRQISGIVTKQWIDNNGFPDAPVITVSNPSEKLEHALNLKLDLYVDDLYSTVREMREAGINALLMAAPFQRGHVEECEGLPTIHSLKEVLAYV